MGLVYKNGEIRSCQVRVLCDGFQCEREGLKRNDDNFPLFVESLRQLLAFRSCVSVVSVASDHFNEPHHLLQLLNRTLDVRVEADSVRHNDDRRELSVTVIVHQSDEFVGNPCDGFGLSRTRRMLYQVSLSDTFFLNVINAFRHAVPLMEAGKHLRRHGLNTTRDVFFLEHFLEHEVVKDAKPVILTADVVPEVARRVLGVTNLHGWIASMTVFCSPVEWQKFRLLLRQVSTHPYFVL